MAVYQVAIIFEAESDEKATLAAEALQERGHSLSLDETVSSAKISFTKFEQEAPEVASE